MPQATRAAGKDRVRQVLDLPHGRPGQEGHRPDPVRRVGRKSGSVEGFSYSAAMKAADKTWTRRRWIPTSPPEGLVPGTKMIFPGLPKPEDRANVIAYLATLK